MARVTARARARFLDRLSETGSVTGAAAASGIARQHWYRLRRADRAFAGAWDEALDAALDALEDEAMRRAVEGVEQPVFHRGEQVGTRRVYSDTLLMFVLERRRPERFVRRKPAPPPPVENRKSDLQLMMDWFSNHTRTMDQDGEEPPDTPPPIPPSIVWPSGPR